MPLASSEDDQPNVVVIVIDALRADHTFGDLAQTPSMDGLAKQGLSFTRFFPEAMPTVPARKSLFSGQRGFPFRDWHAWDGMVESPGWEPLDSVTDSFTSVLKRAGYWTALVTDNPFLAYSKPYRRFRESFDHYAARGGQLGGLSTGVPESALRHWLPPTLDNPKTRLRIQKYLANGIYNPKEKGSFAERVFGDALKAIDLAGRQKPFALVVDTFEPHEPWTPPRKYIDMYGDPDYRGPEPGMIRYNPVSNYLIDGEAEVLIPRMKALYAAEVTMTDYWLGVFLDRLEDRKLDRETMFVLVSDHGVFLGEHDFTGKSSEKLHPELVHTPMVIVDPKRRRAGASTGYFASTHDLAPTILSVAGVETPRRMDGVDLSPLFAGDQPPNRPYAYGGYKNSFFLRSDRWAMSGINRPDDFQLYDLHNDPGETRNLASSEPRTAKRLYEAVKRDAGGELPYYTNLPW
jgi:arylsulfatase A-like enzyme